MTYLWQTLQSIFFTHIPFLPPPSNGLFNWLLITWCLLNMYHCVVSWCVSLCPISNCTFDQWDTWSTIGTFIILAKIKYKMYTVAGAGSSTDCNLSQSSNRVGYSTCRAIVKLIDVWEVSSTFLYGTTEKTRFVNLSLISCDFFYLHWIAIWMSKIRSGQPPDYILKEARNTSKFFKCIGNIHNLENGEASVGRKSVYQALSEEEYEAVSLFISIWLLVLFLLVFLFYSLLLIFISCRGSWRNHQLEKTISTISTLYSC